MNSIRSINDRLSPQQAQWLSHAVGFCGVIAIFGLVWGSLIYPARQEAIRWKSTIDSDSQIVQLGPAICRGRDIAECELFAMEHRLEELRSMIPGRPEESKFLAQVSDLASSTQLKISDFRPGSPESTETLMRINVQLAGACRYSSLCEFLSGLGRLPRLTHVSALKVAPVGEDGLHPVTMQLAIFFARESKTKVARR